ncbi:hypothetical protein DQ04_09181020 [Trypanosoma grayi]|uniref:hypothetical protein n=1 Tax=Trypanosoma grayi TaxID=71804 RepID=UPI0004F459B0|nr:hypothetical protein DQ04_09181020 [Trypanosoma grayi]KEG07650.1 hypothetical protein DQ04_09181020 [Trypanosoma grayi]
MTFSARDAVLNDDEEWFNIPAVVRSFLRQLNNEVQNNRLACDALLQSQREQDGLLKGVASKQMEREFQMTKTVLALQQDRQEDQTSLRELVENMRDQMRHLSEEQQLMRDRVRRMEEREQEAIAMHDSLRAKSTSLSKALNGRSVELETLLHRSVGELSKGFGELEKEVRLISTKQTDMVVESRGELERFNAALQQLCGAVSEEVDSLRAQVQGQEKVSVRLCGRRGWGRVIAFVSSQALRAREWGRVGESGLLIKATLRLHVEGSVTWSFLLF